jgi:FkbM family methyltransferase
MSVKSNELTKIQIVRLLGEKSHYHILDIGTYDGKDARGILDLLPSAEAHCFEADPRSQKLFRSIHPNSEVMNLYSVAIGNVDDMVTFHQSDSDTRRHEHNKSSWSASSSLKEPKEHLELFPEVEFKNSIKVRCYKLDTWYKNNLFPYTIDFIWADVNGAENDVISGGLNTLNKHTRFLYIEFSNKELYKDSIDKQGLLDMLPDFKVLGTYNYQGNFGNVLLKNKNL